MPKFFTVLERPQTADVVIPDGFSWACFFLGPLWALVTRTWPAFWVYVVLNAGAVWFALQNEGESSGVLWFVGAGVNLFVSSKANEWRREGLSDRGYRVKAEMEGPTKEFVLAELSRQAREKA